MKTMSAAAIVVFLVTVAAMAQETTDKEQSPSSHMITAHAAAASVSFAEMKSTVADLERARQATAKYKDIHLAEADGYQQLGTEFPGMGIHFVRTLEVKNFEIENPPILLYHHDPSAPGGYSLVGVGYLWNAPEGPDGQPVNPPFPKSLAHWHRHDNICMLAGLDNPHGLNESQCREKGGHFVAQTQWLVHAWIWQDNSAGVFTSQNPTLK